MPMVLHSHLQDYHSWNVGQCSISLILATMFDLTSNTEN